MIVRSGWGAKAGKSSGRKEAPEARPSRVSVSPKGTGFLVYSWRVSALLGSVQAACTRIKLSGEIETELAMLSQHADRGVRPPPAPAAAAASHQLLHSVLWEAICANHRDVYAPSPRPASCKSNGNREMFAADFFLRARINDLLATVLWRCVNFVLAGVVCSLDTATHLQRLREYLHQRKRAVSGCTLNNLFDFHFSAPYLILGETLLSGNWNCLLG